MSYRLPGFLTVLFFATFAAQLGAQDNAFRDAFRRLSAPSAAERNAAINTIAGLKGNIGGQLRVAYKDAPVTDRRGLFEACEFRGDDALIAQAIQAIAEHAAQPDSDDRLAVAARSYLLALPEAKLKVDESTLDQLARDAWRKVQQFWLRREIIVELLDAVQKPGKYLGQFDSLRKRDAAALDTELMALVNLDAGYGEALAEGAAKRYARSIEAERMYSQSWRRFDAAQGRFEMALRLLRDREAQAALTKLATPVASAVEVIDDLRAAAVRALSAGERGESLKPLLRVLHRELAEYETPALLRNAVNTDTLRTEVELALAHFGDRELLNGRIAGLRDRVARFDNIQANVNYQLASRPDLAARNSAAHLLLRSGDAKAAEAEWETVIKEAAIAARNAKDGQRTALANLMGAVYYNLACAQALQLKLTKAGQSLETACANGYRDFGWMLEDGDLDALRRTPRFAEWFGKLAPPAMVDRFHAGDARAGD